MKSIKLWVALLILGSLVLAACSVTGGNAASTTSPTAGPISASATTNPAGKAAPSTVAPNAPAEPTAANGSGSPSANLRREDAQGAVQVAVTPEDLSNPGEQLIFDVEMNTHSVDLSMDVAGLSTVQTDTGKSVSAQKWDAPAGGGHHVSGKLVFPTKVDGTSLFDGAKSLTLVIKNIDAPERKFTWELNP